MAIRTMIVDDHAFFRKTLCQYLNGFKELDVLNTSGGSREAGTVKARSVTDGGSFTRIGWHPGQSAD